MSEALDLLARSEALLEGHFRLSSGLHSNRYFQCARAFVDPAIGRRLVELLVPQLRGLGVDLVVGPAMGGVVVAYELAAQLGTRTCFTERENGHMTLRRGFSIAPDTQVLIAEDVVTTGGSTAEVVEVLNQCGARVLGLTCLVERSRGNAADLLKMPIFPLLEMDVPTWTAETCPMCADGQPVVKPGSRPG